MIAIICLTALINKLLEVLVYIAFGKISKTVDRGKTSEMYITKDSGNSFIN